MKRQFALLIAMSFLVSGLASFAEEAAKDAETAQTEIVETADMNEDERIEPFVDGSWLNVPEWNAEVYLPAGWMLSEVSETGFVAADAEGVSTMTAVIEPFMDEQTAEGAAAADDENEETVWSEADTEAASETEAAEETDASSETGEVELTAFESYLMGLGVEYELAMAGEREMAIFSAEDSLSVQFVVNSQLVNLTFAPAEEGGIADSALSIAQTFYIYNVEETEAVDGDIAAEEAAATEVEETKAE